VQWQRLGPLDVLREGDDRHSTVAVNKRVLFLASKGRTRKHASSLACALVLRSYFVWPGQAGQ
jgi:hypothetical protein